MEKINSFKLWKQDPSKGEVFTPIVIINKKLDRIPEHIWTNPKSTFCDLSMGKGTYLIEVVNRLVNIYGYSEEDAKSRVFGYDIRVKYVNFLKRRGYKNVFHRDSLVENFNMKFDVVIGNSPYQKQVGPNKTEAIWPKFVEKAFEICKEGGYVSMIHPSGWRNVDGKFKNIQKLILSKDIKYLEMHNEKDGIEYFGATTSFDWYVIKNINEHYKTKVKTQDGKIYSLNLTKLEFIPNGEFDKIFHLVTKKGEETVNVLYSRSDYGTDKRHMSKVKTEEHIYPCVYTTLKDNTINLYWSNTNQNGHFNLSKLIWSNGMASSLQLDCDGIYGLTQFSYGIIDTPKNLEFIKKVMESEIFTKLIGSCYMSSGDRFNRKVISTFRKDFWKEFLDENGNIIEPNFNENVESI